MNYSYHKLIRRVRGIVVCCFVRVGWEIDIKYLKNHTNLKLILMSFGKSLPSFFHLIMWLPLYGIYCSNVLLIKLVSINGKTVVVVVVVVGYWLTIMSLCEDDDDDDGGKVFR
jgi:hypothetical protein